MIRRAARASWRRVRRHTAQWSSQADLAVRRRAWSWSGRTGVPDSVWPAPLAATTDEHLPVARRLVPLPPAWELSRWLWGTRAPGLDGSDRSFNRVGVVLSGIAGGSDGDPACFPEHRVGALLQTRASLHAGRGPHTVLLVQPGASGRVQRLARRAGVHRGILIVENSGADRRAAILGLLSSLAVPADAAEGVKTWPDSVMHEAEAAGVPVIGHEPSRPLPDVDGPGPELRDRSRQARLQAVVAGSGADSHADPQEPGPSPADTRVHVAAERRRVVVAGHDLKFATSLIDQLRAGGHEVRLDHWRGHERHDPALSGELARWADAVFCEWTLGNAVWYSRHAPPGTRLTTRLHLQEAGTGFPSRLAVDRVDAVVFVAEHVRRQVVRDSGVPEGRTLVVPNAVRVPDAPVADPATRFRLGLVGPVPARKGLHAALDVLARLRSTDDRYSLHIKGHHPEDVPWLDGRPDEKAYFERQLARIRTDPVLAGAVHFDPFTPDMEQWYAGIGVALSTSDFESFHFTLADGAVHGCVPRSLAWPGADLLYPASWLAADAGTLTDSVRAATQVEDKWSREAGAARELIIREYGDQTVIPRLAAQILGGSPYPASVS